MILSFIVNVIAYETSASYRLMLQKYSELTHISNGYLKIREIYLQDPFYKDIVEELNITEKKLQNIFLARKTAHQEFVANPRFYTLLISYYLEQKLNGIDALIDKSFKSFSDFKDLIIIDQDKNLIYKHGKESIHIKFYNVGKQIIATNFGNLYATIGNYSDSALNTEFQIMVLYDYSKLIEIVKVLPYGGFALINNTLIRHPNFTMNEYEFRKLSDSLKSNDKVTKGLKVIKKIQFGIGDTVLGMMGVIYPTRSVESFLLMVLKTLLILISLVLLVLIDRMIIRRVKYAANRSIQNGKKQFEKHHTSERDKKHIQEEQLMNKEFTWIENFITDTDEPR